MSLQKKQKQFSQQLTDLAVLSCRTASGPLWHGLCNTHMRLKSTSLSSLPTEKQTHCKLNTFDHISKASLSKSRRFPWKCDKGTSFAGRQDLQGNLQPEQTKFMVEVHTGNMDVFGKGTKKTIPASLSSKVKGKRHVALSKCLRRYQWRWQNTGKTLQKYTLLSL